MSAIAFVVVAVIAGLATLFWALISGGWTWRAFAAMFVFALALLLLPSLIHA